MPFLTAKNTIALTIPAGQYIRVGNVANENVEMLTLESGRINGPVIDIPQVTSGIGTRYGPYAVATNVVLNNYGNDAIEYIVGNSGIVLTDQVYNPASVAITGGTIAGATISGGSINTTPVGNTTRSTGAFTTIAMPRGDSTGTPGNVTNNNPVGRAAIAAAGTACVVTNSSVTATSEVLITDLDNDTTAVRLRVSAIAAGSFTVTANVAATATTRFNFLVINP